MHPSQLGFTTTSLPHDTHTTTPSYSSPTSAAAEALNNLFLIDQSEDYKRTAELLDIGLPNYADGPSPPPPPLMFDTTMCDTTGMASMSIAQRLQQQQIVDLDSEPHESGGAGSQQPSTSGWRIVETAGLLLDDINSHHQHHQHHHYPQHHYLHQIPVIQSLKRRRRLTTEESEFLMGQFNLNDRPTAQERDSFATHLKLDRRTIQVWFQNRRAKLKRDERGGGGQGGITGGVRN
ncbi:hypothetical protein BGZ47_007959 [Haplosporangium gracile]|nr:hypothetical protein BGZ47_007959 [Haplosporangium gracile]